MTEIPAPVIAVVAEVLEKRYTHSRLNNLFTMANAPGDPPDGNKLDKCRIWLKRASRDPGVDGLEVLGGVIEEIMEIEPSVLDPYRENKDADRDRISEILARHGLAYHPGGTVTKSGATGATKSLEQLIRERDLPSVLAEFDRALESVESRPRDAVSAAANILEAVCKTYIEDEGLAMRAKQDLGSVWGVVRRHLGFDPAAVEDDDLKKILGGLFSIVDGAGALRTHASTAHAQGRRAYRVEPRHARLAVHAAHTAAGFILETWWKRSA